MKINKSKIINNNSRIADFNSVQIKNQDLNTLNSFSIS